MASDGKRLKIKYRKMSRMLNDMGFTALLVDGFNPRGFSEVCSNAHIDPITRLKHSPGGLAYLRSLGDVAEDKIARVAWGTTGSLQGMNKATP